MSRYSISRVNTYLENPFKHWCKYIAGYKIKSNPEYTKYMDRGTVFHKCAELMAQKPQENPKQVANQVAQYYAGEFLDDAITAGITAFYRYMEEYHDTAFERVIETEYQLDYVLPNGQDFIGFIDAIVDNMDGTVSLVDYKTYSNAPNKDKLKFSLQANLYMAVASRLGFTVKDFTFDCVNPKPVLKGRAYRTKRLTFPYNEAMCDEYLEQFTMLTDIIENNPELKVYTPGDYMPDPYDYLYKVWVGEINEDLDTYIQATFDVEEEKTDEE